MRVPFPSHRAVSLNKQGALSAHAYTFCEESPRFVVLEWADCRASSPIASNTASVYIEHMTSPWIDNDEWLDWYKLTPAERWRESQKLWEFFLSVGGSLDPEPDSESPFDSFYAQRALPPDGRAGVRIVRRG